MMFLFVLQLCACFVLCFGQDEVKTHDEPEYKNTKPNAEPPSSLELKSVKKPNLYKFFEATGNFSLELLYHTAKQEGNQNLVVSPFAAWTMLAVTSEGASGNTRQELLGALRFPRYTSKRIIRHYFQVINRWLTVNTTTARYTKFNALFVNKSEWGGMLRSFRQISEEVYGTDAVDLDFKNIAATTATINRAVSLTTNGWIPELISESHLSDIQIIIASAVYFEGQWTAPFDVSSTTKQDFYNSMGEKIGEVNMMHNRYTYPFADMREFQATVIELPYGVENHLSMIVMMPDPEVTLNDMFLKFSKLHLNTVFQELRVSKEVHVEIDCFIPRFKTDTNIDPSEILKIGMGIYELFDPKKIIMSQLSNWPISGVKVIHKTVIAVTEEGPSPSENITGEYANHTIVTFTANRPFIYFIVEKHTNTIILAGMYQRPILY